MTTAPPAAPHTFISYSWSSLTHESWVLNLASRLREDGVDVVLDKWDLKPGHDAYVFMESMVTDPNVTKVLMICDRTYVAKANSRTGGVGTESQIISPELYGASAQDKYAAVMVDEDDDGNAHVPVFYKGRIFFDFRSVDRFEDAYEQLLRWLVDRPMHVKPKLGAVPEHILQTQPAASATQSRARRAEEAIRQGLPSAPALIREYGDALAVALRDHAITRVEGEAFDDAVVNAITAMRPYLRQLADIAAAAVRFTGDDRRVWDRVLGLHEQLGTLMYRDHELTQWLTQQFDAYKAVAHEAFLTTLALTLDEERFDLAAAMLKRPYLVHEHDGGSRPATSDFTVFRQYVQSLDERNRRLNLNRRNLQADRLHDAHPRGSVPGYQALMQADLVCYLRSAGQPTAANWYPLSLVYLSHSPGPLPIFARAESLSYFEQLAPVLGVASLDEFRARVADVNASGQTRSMFDYGGLPVGYLVNIEHLGKLD